MQRVYSLTDSAYFTASDAQKAVQEAADFRERVARAKSQADGAAGAALDDFERKVAALAGPAAPGGRGGGGGVGAATSATADTLNGASAALTGAMNLLQGADVRPTALQVATIETAVRSGRAALARWRALKAAAPAGLTR
jgi:hypothetical protein